MKHQAVLNIEHALASQIGDLGLLDTLDDAAAMALYLCYIDRDPVENNGKTHSHYPYVQSALRSPPTPLAFADATLRAMIARIHYSPEAKKNPKAAAEATAAEAEVKQEAARLREHVRGIYLQVRNLPNIRKAFSFTDDGEQDSEGAGTGGGPLLPLLSEQRFLRALSAVQSRTIGMQVRSFHSPHSPRRTKTRRR